MSTEAPFWSSDFPCSRALPWIRSHLALRGLRALQTFDLHGTRLGADDCRCPHHGTAKCDCQMVVLLVYGREASPATLVLHGNDGRSWLSLVHNPMQPACTSLRQAIEEALLSNPSQ